MALAVGPCVRCGSKTPTKEPYELWSLLGEGWVCGKCLPETPSKSVACPKCSGTGSIQVPDEDVPHDSKDR